MMTEYEFKQAILTRILEADFLDDEQIDVPNSKGFKPSDNGVWLRVGFSGVQGVFSGFGSQPCTRRTGLVMIQCFMPAQEYTQPIDDLTDKLVALLEWYHADGFELHAADVIVAGQTRDDAFYQKNVHIPFVIKPY